VFPSNISARHCLRRGNCYFNTHSEATVSDESDHLHNLSDILSYSLVNRRGFHIGSMKYKNQPHDV